MQITELGNVLQYIQKIFTEQDLINKYQEILNLLNQQRETPSETTSKELNDKLNTLISLQQNLQPSNWTYLREKAFNQLGGNQYIGIAAAERINKIFSDNKADSFTAAQKIQELINELNQFLQTIQSLNTNLSNLFQQTKEQLQEGETILQLVFKESVAIDTLAVLEEQSKNWQFIIRGFSQLAKEPAKEARILSISKASPTMIEIAGSAGTLWMIAKAVEKVLDIYKKKLEIDNLELQNRKLEDEELNKAFQKHKDSKISSMLEQATNDMTEGRELNGEIITTIKMCFERLFEFISKGGQADIASEKHPKDVNNITLQLDTKYKDIKALESQVQGMKLLEENIDEVVDAKDIETNNDETNEDEIRDDEK